MAYKYISNILLMHVLSWKTLDGQYQACCTQHSSPQLGNDRSQRWIFQQALFDYPWGTIIMGTKMEIYYSADMIEYAWILMDIVYS